MSNPINRFLGKDDLTVSEAMRLIDANTCGILFLTDEAGRLTGCLTDGDVRRYLLRGGKMSGPAMDAANKNAEELLESLNLEYNHVRQSAITQEITEVSAGSRGQKKSKKKREEREEGLN